MKDAYPTSLRFPTEKLVSPCAQPEYHDLDTSDVTNWNVGYQLANAIVARGQGHRIAAIHGETGREYSFSELERRSDEMALGLRAFGIRQSDRIALRTVNEPEFLIVLLAIWKAGAIAVPLPAQATSAEINYLIADTTPRVIFCHARVSNLHDVLEVAVATGVEALFAFGDEEVPAGFRSTASLLGASVGELPTTDPDQLAIIWHTGGTTGRPKGCYHTHRRFLFAGIAFGRGAGVAPDQRWAAAAPVGHALGLIHHTIFTLLHGATVVLMERFNDAETLLRAIGDLKITNLTALMGSWAKLADAIEATPGAETSSLTRCFAMWQSASSSRTFEFWRDRGIELLNNFGSTSFATWVLIPPKNQACPRAALGKPLPGYKVEAVEVRDGKVHPVPNGMIGQMAVKGPTGLTYWGLPETQSRDVVEGWTLSDDLISFDGEGFAHHLGRTDYMISTGGFKVAPAEVEEVLARHPSVREVAVVPGPCPRNVEMVVAYLAIDPGTRGTDSLRAELQQSVRAVLSSYKIPRRIEFVDALPRDLVGKVQTRIVKAWAYGLEPNS